MRQSGGFAMTIDATELSRPVRLVGQRQRAYACHKIGLAPDGWIVSLKEPTRTLDQSAKMWAMLGDVVKAEPMGRKHTSEEWKFIFMAACGWEVAFLPGLSGQFFPVGFRSSKLTVKQMAELITFIQQWGDEQGIVWSEPASAAA
jgi:hypothetical protein